MMIPKTYGFDAVKMSERLTMGELNVLREMITDDPANANPDRKRGSIYLYSKAARRKLDALAWAVTYKLQETRNSAA